MGVKIMELDKEVVEEVHQKLRVKDIFLLGIQHVAAMCA